VADNSEHLRAQAFRLPLVARHREGQGVVRSFVWLARLHEGKLEQTCTACIRARPGCGCEIERLSATRAGSADLVAASTPEATAEPAAASHSALPLDLQQGGICSRDEPFL